MLEIAGAGLGSLVVFALGLRGSSRVVFLAGGAMQATLVGIAAVGSSLFADGDSTSTLTLSLAAGAFLLGILDVGRRWLWAVGTFLLGREVILVSRGNDLLLVLLVVIPPLFLSVAAFLVPRHRRRVDEVEQLEDV